MPPYKEQGIVLRSYKLGEADKIVTVMTQGSGKVRAVAKGIRKTKSRFGARLEPFTHVNLMLYRGRGALDTVTQAEIIAPHMTIRDDLARFAAGEDDARGRRQGGRGARAERSPHVAPARGLSGARRRSRRRGRGRRVVHAEAAVALGLPPVAHGVRGLRRPRSAAVGCQPRRRGVRAMCRAGRRPVLRPALEQLAAFALADLNDAGAILQPDPRVRRESRALLYSFAEYHLERRMKSVPMLVRTTT